RAREHLLLSGGLATEPWPEWKPGVPPLTWIGPAFVPQIRTLAAPGREETTGIAAHDGVRVAWTIVRPDSLPVGASPEVNTRVDGGDRTSGARDHATRPLDEVSDAVLAPPVATFSYTSLAEHERCGYRFYLERVLRLPQVDDVPGAGLSGGRGGGLDA